MGIGAVGSEGGYYGYGVTGKGRANSTAGAGGTIDITV